MSNDSTLHNSYKCYDSIPTPSPTALDDSKRGSGSNNVNFMHQSFPSNSNNNNSTAGNLLRTASLDSLINSSEQDSGSNHSDDDDEDVISSSDSLTELSNICDNNSKNNSYKESIESCVDYEIERRSDIEELKNGLEPQKEPVIQAYLEKCHIKCEYKNCCFKKSSIESETKKSSSSQNQTKSNLSSRRNSIASAVSASRMETILEEPVEPKVSVKEILARFETLREAAEVMRVKKLDECDHGIKKLWHVM